MMGSPNQRPKKIVIDDSILRSVEKHSYSNLEAEVGGMFFGHVEGGKTIVSGSIPALKAEAQQIRLTFTQEVWQEILREGDKFFPGEQIVGWYHTHPSFGLFLSEYDQFIQKNFFSSPGQIALVVDPIAGQMGWFELKKNGDVPMIFEEPTKAGPRVAPGSTNASSKAGLGKAGLIAGTSVLTAALTYGILATFAAPDQQAFVQELLLENQALLSQNTTLATKVGYVEGQLVLEYTVRDTDTIDKISQLFYQDVAAKSFISKNNPNLDLAKLSAGQVLRIVAPYGYDLGTSVVEVSPTPKPASRKTNQPSASPTPNPITSGAPIISPSPSPSAAPSEEK